MKAPLSETHGFLLALHLAGKLLRNYTQNIDGLEERAGLPLVESPHHKYMYGGYVSLHGALLQLQCKRCYRCTFFAECYIASFSIGEAPECHWCQIEGEWQMCHPLYLFMFFGYQDQNPQKNTKQLRQREMGRLYPNIALYNAPHSSSDDIADIVSHDLKQEPDFLCIMGTSLSIEALNSYIRRFAKDVRMRGGITVFINKEPPNSQWHSTFDYHVMGDVDECSREIGMWWRTKKPEDWGTGVHKNEVITKYKLAERPVVEWPQ